MKRLRLIETLIAYGLREGLIGEVDAYVVRNDLYQYLQIGPDEIPATFPEQLEIEDIYQLLDELVEAVKGQEKGDFHLTYLYEVDAFKARIMSYLLPRQSELEKHFYTLLESDPQKATAYFYHLSNASIYIRGDRVSKNLKWQSPSEYGDLDMTINLSKPEKDPKEIAMMKNASQSQYPKCLLCAENAGFSGTVTHPSRYNHRIVPITLQSERWFLQYSPYVYYNEHAIVLCESHREMKISKDTFCRLADFVDFLPHYFIGSNADLPIVGGSILSHDHYQGGHYEMPMMRADVAFTHVSQRYPHTEIEGLIWPLSVLRLVGQDKQEIIDLADHILKAFIHYSDESVGLLAYTVHDKVKERHNTITPIMRKTNRGYELFLALRNNRTDAEHPEGIFHPHREHHHIKKENIGLIEVMGLAVLPARLEAEMKEMKAYLKGTTKTVTQALEKHVDWLDHLENVPQDEKALDGYLKNQMGLKFECVLEDAGIFKRDYHKMKQFIEKGAQL